MKAYMALKAHAPERFDDLRELARRCKGSALAVHAGGQTVQWRELDSEDREWMEGA